MTENSGNRPYPCARITRVGNRAYCVYILSNASHRLYVGVTGDLERRIAEHKTKSLEGFSSRYNLTRLSAT